MALELHIPPCVRTPAHLFHFPPWEKPLRICIEGPLGPYKSCYQMHNGTSMISDLWCFHNQPAPNLQNWRIEHSKREVSGQVTGDMLVRDEYLGWVMKDQRPLPYIDYYGVTFDHIVPAEDDEDPEVLQINIIEMDDDAREYAKDCLLFTVHPADYTGKKVLAVPRCCGKRKCTSDRFRVYSSVVDREWKVP